MAANITNDDILLFESEAWHRQGVVLNRLIQWEDIEGLVLPVAERRPLFYVGDDGELVEYTDRQVLVDVNYKSHVLGDVKPSYGIVQFERIRETAQAFLQTGMVDGLASFLTIDGRRKAATSIKLNGEFELKGYSKVEPYINVGTSHDGSSSFIAAMAHRIVVCANTFQANLLSKPKVWSVRHTRNGDIYAGEAIKVVEDALKLQVEIRNAVEKLINEPFTEADFDKLADDIFRHGHGGNRPIPSESEDSRARSIYENFRLGIDGRYRGADIAPVQDTKWGALMAVQGYEQHVANGTKDRQGRHLDRLYFGRLPLSEYAARKLGVAELVK